MTEDGLDVGPSAVAVPAVAAPLSKLERDYALVDIYVRVQHLRYDEASVLIEGLLAIGEVTPEVLLAKAVVQSMLGQNENVLDTIRLLERIEPAEIISGKGLTEHVRVRSFIKARAKFGLAGELDDDARAALDFYLRQGKRTRRAK